MPPRNEKIRPLMLAWIGIAIAAGVYAIAIGKLVPALIGLLIVAVGAYLYFTGR